MAKQNDSGVSDSLDCGSPMEIDRTEEQINSSSQSDSKLYESNNKNIDTKHSFSETVTKRETRAKEENESRDEKKDTLRKKCIEKRSSGTEIKCSINKESTRDPVRAESMIRQTITKMEKHRTVIPGMASARSLTNLISADYGWKPSAVYSKVEKALKSAADHGLIKEMINKENGQRSYTVPNSKVKKYIRSVHGPAGDSRKHLHKQFSNLMNKE